MAKHVIIIDEKEDGTFDVNFTSSAPFPERYEDYTPGQILFAQLHEAVATALENKDA